MERELREVMVNRMATQSTEVTRRSFLQTSAAAVGFAVSPGLIPTANASAEPATDTPTSGKTSAKPSTFLDLLRVPDTITAFDHFEKTLPQGMIPLGRRGETWTGKDVVVECKSEPNALVLTLESPSTPIAAVHLRWQMNVSHELLVLGDAWERSYGELGWRNQISERVMPWYFATFDQSSCHCYGVKTDAKALCFWQLDLQGVSLWLNVANGGNGVELGRRQLTIATVVSRRGAAGEEAIAGVTDLCRQMCARRSRPTIPIYGANDWCYSYGQSTAETILRDTDFIVEVSPAKSPRPFSVIDGGWTNGTDAWPDMGKLASDIRQRTVRPGLWVRPSRLLKTPTDPYY